MSDDLDLQRINLLLEVSNLVYHEGMSVKDACERVDLPSTTYYRWLRKDKGVITTIRSLRLEQLQEELHMLTSTDVRRLRFLVSAALDPLVESKDKVIINKYLDERLNHIETVLNARPGIEEEAHKFLKAGPKLESQDSRMLPVDQEKKHIATLQLAESGNTIDITLFQEPEEVLEGEFQDSPQEEPPTST